MCAKQQGDQIFFFFPFFLCPPPLLGAQCQAGHGPCRLSRHCALRFQGSLRIIPGARTGISSRRSPGRCPHLPGGAGAGGAALSAGAERSGAGGWRLGVPGPPERDAGLAPRRLPPAAPSPRVKGPLPDCPPRLPDFYLDNWKCRGGCAPPASRGALQPRSGHLVIRGCLGRGN